MGWDEPAMGWAGLASGQPGLGLAMGRPSAWQRWPWSAFEIGLQWAGRRQVLLCSGLAMGSFVHGLG
jgi:hypothetical protein